MTWVKLDDRFAEHPKVVDLSDAAFRAYIAALCYSAGLLTDGAVPAAVVSRWKPKAVAELIKAGLWERRNPGGIQIHDYLDYQQSGEQVRARRASDSGRKKGGA